MQKGLIELERNDALYKTIFIVQDLENSFLASLQEQDSLILLTRMKTNKERLREAETDLLLSQDKKIQERCQSFYEKLDLALAGKDQKRFLKIAKEYKSYLYQQMRHLNIGRFAPASADLENIGYLLSTELPLNTILLTELGSVSEAKTRLIKIGSFKGSIEKTGLILEELDIYKERFKELDIKYANTVEKYIHYLTQEDVRRAFEMQESVLSLQLSLFNALHSLVDNYLQAQYKETRTQYQFLLAGILFSLLLGLYLMLGTYIGLRFSLRQFFDTARDISQGRLDSRVKIESSDELGLLSYEFNSMIESLDYHYSLLNEYKKAIDASAIIVKTDIHGIITYVNEAYEQISAYKKEELIGSTHRIVQSKSTSHEQIVELWNYIKNRKVYKTVFENIAKTGKSFFVESTIVPVLDRSGEIKEFISIMFDLTPLYRQKERLQSQLYIDELTSIPNRLKLLEDIAITESPKLVVINIDGFKEINTIYGESIGDLTLQKMSKEIKNALNTRHLQLYKLTADEFAILAGKEISIENFREDVAMLSHYLSHIHLECAEHEISIRLSLGAAISELHHSQRPLISMADMALKEANRRMRPYQFYNDIASIDEDLEKNYKMIQLIEQSIKDDKVRCCYQGIINAKTGKIEKYETLMRLEDENGKNVFPHNFVDIAKRTRFYPKLTQKVVQEAVYTFLHRQESVSINLSIDDIMDDSTYAFILDVLRNCSCAERIIFEFLETEEIEFNERMLTFTTQVKKMGAQIAIDDFGSGYSNYAYLMKLGVDILKIDASLIKDVEINNNSRLIAQSIINIAHALGMKTVAEHVHTKAVEEIMISMGVDYLQGYYLHKPVSTLDPTF